MSGSVRSLRVARWMIRSARGPWLRIAVPRLTVLGFGVVEVDAVVDWGATTALLQARSATETAAACAGLAALIALSERRATRTLLLGERHAVIRRQPLPGGAYGPGVTALVAPLLVPAAGLGGLWHGSPWGALLWAAAVLCPVTAWAADRRAVALAAVAPAGALAGVARAVPALLPIVALLSLLAVPFAGRLFAAAEPEILPPIRSRTAGLSGPRTALLHRDLLALWRMERHLLGGPLLVPAPAALVVLAMRVNGPYGDEATTAGAAVGLAAAGVGALQLPATAAGRLGAGYDPPHWPIRALDRALVTAALAGLGVLPTAVAVGLAARLPLVDQLRLGVLLLELAAGAALWIAARPTRPGFGSWPWWVGMSLVPVLVPGAWPVGVLLAVAALVGAARLLERRRRWT